MSLHISHIYNLRKTQDGQEGVVDELTRIGLYKESRLTFKYYKQGRPKQEIGDGRYVAFYNAIKNASKHNYQRIMILWDDVQFFKDVNEAFDTIKNKMFVKLNCGGEYDCIMTSEVINAFNKRLGKLYPNWFEDALKSVRMNFVLNELMVCDSYKTSTNVALCCIAKNENPYIREWVEHYIKLGVSRIYIYDNNEVNGERFEDVIGDYIEQGYVVVKDVRGVEKGCVYDENNINLQPACYYKCYETECSGFDWICFFDVDEFLDIKCGNIKTLLSSQIYEGYGTVCVSWEHFCDNGQITFDDRPVTERFTQKSSINRYGIKSIVRTGYQIDDKTVRNMIHCFRLRDMPICYIDGSDLKTTHEDGNKITWWNMPVAKHQQACAVLNHYKTKSLEEYMSRHMGRHWGTSLSFTQISKNIYSCVLDYFRYNEITEDKIKYINEHFQNIDTLHLGLVLINSSKKCNIEYLNNALDTIKKCDLYYVVVKYNTLKQQMEEMLNQNMIAGFELLSMSQYNNKFEYLKKIFKLIIVMDERGKETEITI